MNSVIGTFLFISLAVISLYAENYVNHDQMFEETIHLPNETRSAWVSDHFICHACPRSYYCKGYSQFLNEIGYPVLSKPTEFALEEYDVFLPK